MITDILSDVTRRGTARRANGSFKNVAIAGKTGTSRDGWFVGYTPNLVCAVWVGYDDNKQLGLTGAEAALPAWIEFMKEARHSTKFRRLILSETEWDCNCENRSGDR